MTDERIKEALAAERLVKIEILEEVLDRTDRCYMAQAVWEEIETMIAELKKEGE